MELTDGSRECAAHLQLTAISVRSESLLGRRRFEVTSMADERPVVVNGSPVGPIAWVIGVIVVVAAVLFVMFYWHPWSATTTTNTTTVTQPANGGVQQKSNSTSSSSSQP
jgi:hypothetical protein